MTGRTLRLPILSAVMLSLAATSVPAAAQDNAETRVRKLEAEVRALQRSVFPGGDGRYFEPEITRPQAQPSPNAASTTTTAVTDILARLDAIEAQMQRLTGRVEENGFAVGSLDERIAALEAGKAAAEGAVPGETVPAETSTEPAGDDASTAQPGPSPERIAAVQAIAKPQTGDAADDEYSYGFRLWDAGFYPEAQQQLTMFLDRHGDHWRATYGRNLLGRAYLDDNKARDAAPWFLQNYQSDKTGARAGDSLLYLAETMVALGDINRACIALAEFGETYPALATGRLQSQYERNRARVECD